MINLNLIKWAATMVLIVGSAVNSSGFYPQGPLVLLAGGVLWLLASLQMRDLQLIVTNSVMVLAGAVPLLWRYYNG